MSAITISEKTLTTSEVALIINGKEEVYSVQKLPDIKSQLVLDSHQDMLGKLSIDILVTNFENTADFIFLAFNALAGTEVWAKVSGLQKSLLDLTGDCVNVLDIFGIQSQEVGKALIKSYNLLLQRKDKLAMIQLRTCGKIARDMALQSQQLADKIINLSAQSNTINGEVITLKSLTESEKANLVAKLNDLKAKNDAAEVTRKKLAEDMERLTREYYASVAKLQDGWFVGAVKAVANFCGIRVRDPKEDALRETHATYNRDSQRYNQLILENLNELKQYAQQMSVAQSGISDATKAAENFYYANRGISGIIAALADATIFWKTIETYCTELEKSGFSNAVSDYQGNLSPEELMREYTSKEFILIFVKNLSQWVALNSVCQQYRTGAQNTYHKIANNIQASPSIEQAKSQTPILAKRILAVLDKQISALQSQVEKDRRWGNYLNVVNANLP
jgi:hypothetical protein